MQLCKLHSSAFADVYKLDSSQGDYISRLNYYENYCLQLNLSLNIKHLLHYGNTGFGVFKVF